MTPTDPVTEALDAISAAAAARAGAARTAAAATQHLHATIRDQYPILRTQSHAAQRAATAAGITRDGVHKILQAGGPR